jgi:hypothetical protein
VRIGGHKRRRRFLLGGLAAIILALIAIMILAEPLARNPAGAGHAGRRRREGGQFQVAQGQALERRGIAPARALINEGTFDNNGGSIVTHPPTDTRPFQQWTDESAVPTPVVITVSDNVSP